MAGAYAAFLAINLINQRLYPAIFTGIGFALALIASFVSKS